MITMHQRHPGQTDGHHTLAIPCHAIAWCGKNGTPITP